ncbi:MAG TPA: DUF2079 domain-containing protein, partial [Candidatus Margulisiibacteriota bacterium]|nr:DUF2079 domain-containing protein [Candidatus Margulisiibacteriota bacterium]
MKKFLLSILNTLINLYSLLYLGLFLTDYSFMIKKGISNIAGPTAGMFFLLALSFLLDKDSFSGLYLPRILKSFIALPDKIILAVLSLSSVLVISTLGIARHLSFSTMAWDMGLFDQAIWNTLHGDLLFSSIRGNLFLLGDHFEPILFLVVPFYY